MKSLANQVALVTGSAKRTGRDIALGLAEAGADVVIHYRGSREEAEATVAEVQAKGRRAIAIKADLRETDQVEALFAQAHAEFGRLDILVNNVGNITTKSISELSYDEWHFYLDTTLNVTFYCCKNALSYMRQQKRGRIINMADSFADTIPAAPNTTPYRIGKTGVMILTKSLAVAEGPHNITVNAVSPGTLANSESKPPLENVPLGRYGETNDIVNAILFLVSDEADYITGTNIKVAGGWNL